MSLTYVGNCEWEPSGEPEPRNPPKGLPTTMEPWIGRSDKLAAFLVSKPVGASYLGGYIIDNTPRDRTPFDGAASVDLIVARPPSFSAYEAGGGLVRKTAQKSASITNATIWKSIAGRDATAEELALDGFAYTVDCEKVVTYDSPETTYRYFTSSRPSGPRFHTEIGGNSVRIRRTRVTARTQFAQAQRIYTGGSAPGAIVTALSMAEVNIVSMQCDEIVGTPWFQCVDTVTRELQGD